MSETLLDRAPRLASGCRLGTAAGQEDVLLIPECALRLKGSGRAIIELCDGVRSVRTIVTDLALRYSADAARVEADVLALLVQLSERGVLEYQ